MYTPFYGKYICSLKPTSYTVTLKKKQYGSIKAYNTVQYIVHMDNLYTCMHRSRSEIRKLGIRLDYIYSEHVHSMYLYKCKTTSI